MNIKKDVLDCKGIRDEMKKTFLINADVMKEKMTVHILGMEKEMQDRFASQKAENSRLRQHISQQNSEKVVIKNQIIALQRRIESLNYK